MHLCDITVMICTWNRASMLRDTLTSLAGSNVADDVTWEVVVVDNNSTDETAAVVRSAASAFPTLLRYVFEPRQGRSCAMNAGIAATLSPIIVFTDDDVEVSAGWLAAACAPLLRPCGTAAYTGGPVRPRWEAPPPGWFSGSGRSLWGTLAILDYGDEPFVFEERRRVPLGVNFAVRRSLIERVGGFDPTLGRGSGAVPLGQELPEFFARTRSVGAHGQYVPAMELYHHIPARRLRAAYWRRWWFGKGISRARLERRHPVTELGLDLTRVPTVLGVPRFLFGNALRDVVGWCVAVGRRDTGRRVAHETQLCYFSGQLFERRRLRSRTLDRLGPAIPRVDVGGPS